MCRYSANKVLIFVFVEISINFVANYTTFSLHWTRKHGIVTIAVSDRPADRASRRPAPIRYPTLPVQTGERESTHMKHAHTLKRAMAVMLALVLTLSLVPLSKPLSVKGFCNVSPGRT